MPVAQLSAARMKELEWMVGQWVDKDDNGRAHAQAVARSLAGKVKSIRVVECPDVNGKAVKDSTDVRHDVYPLAVLAFRVYRFVAAVP